MSDRAVRVRFKLSDDVRGEARSSVMSLPTVLKETGALALGEVFEWPALNKALGLRAPFGGFRVTAVGTEGNLLGTGELVIHVV